MIKTDIDKVDIAEITIKNVLSLLNCSRIGKVISFNPDKYTVSVEIMQLFESSDKNFIPTILPDVPLMYYGCKNGGITPPDPSGQFVLLVVNDRNIDNFLTTGEQYEPANGRMHSYADCVALLTLNSYIDEPVMYDANALTLYNGTQFAKIFNDSIELYAVKIKLYNSQTTLLTLIKSLITEIQNITVNTSTSNVAQEINNKAAFDTIATNFEGLLE